MTRPLPEGQVKELQFYDRSNTLLGFAIDYADKRARIDELVKDRDGHQRKSPEWLAAHRHVVTSLAKLHSWLEQSLFSEAAKKMESELTRERKQLNEAFASRGIAAKASIQAVDTPPSLRSLAEEIAPGVDVFKVQESQHARIVYRDGFPDARIRMLLELAEEVIEGFRVEFVDPFVDEEFKDYISDSLFAEWWFGPDDVGKYERYYTDYYGLTWGSNKEERLKLYGTAAMRSMGPPFLNYRRSPDNADLEGQITHALGHHLAQMHYDRKRGDMSQDWLGEAAGYHVSLEWLGRNTSTCKQFAPESVYAHQVKKEGEKTAQEGLRDWLNALALQSGPSIDRLATKSLFEMGDAELAKSWSYFDYLARKGGKQGQEFLRAACDTARNERTFIADWRAKSQEIFEIDDQDVFAALEKRWREYALAGQETGDARRKR